MMYCEGAVYLVGPNLQRTESNIRGQKMRDFHSGNRGRSLYTLCHSSSSDRQDSNDRHSSPPPGSTTRRMLTSLDCCSSFSVDRPPQKLPVPKGPIAMHVPKYDSSAIPSGIHVTVPYPLLLQGDIASRIMDTSSSYGREPGREETIISDAISETVTLLYWLNLPGPPSASIADNRQSEPVGIGDRWCGKRIKGVDHRCGGA